MPEDDDIPALSTLSYQDMLMTRARLKQLLENFQQQKKLDGNHDIKSFLLQLLNEEESPIQSEEEKKPD